MAVSESFINVNNYPAKLFKKFSFQFKWGIPRSENTYLKNNINLWKTNVIFTTPKKKLGFTSKTYVRRAFASWNFAQLGIFWLMKPFFYHYSTKEAPRKMFSVGAYVTYENAVWRVVSRRERSENGSWLWTYVVKTQRPPNRYKNELLKSRTSSRDDLFFCSK